ncbi:MAG: tetratricopeptide repeat protein [Magnetospirillum sp.]|nr:tetratricopeptide repeat protein [Magnetospirillum sp.]
MASVAELVAQAQRFAGEGRLVEAETAFRRAIAQEADNPLPRARLMTLLRALKRSAEAIAEAETILSLDPTNWRAAVDLGEMQAEQGRAVAAVAAYRQSVSHGPRAGTWARLGPLLAGLGDHPGARDAYRESLALDPTQPLRFMLAYECAFTGQWREAFAAMEGRFAEIKCPRGIFAGAPVGQGAATALVGKPVVVRWEQGIGDTIQFLRYLPRLKAITGAPVVLECQTVLEPLLKTVAGADVVIANDAAEVALPFADPVTLPLMSLPYVLGDDAPMAMAAPYLPVPKPPPAELCALRSPRVGVVWQGNRKHPNDAHRSMPVMALAPLLAVPGITFVCLQIGERSYPTVTVPAMPWLHDFADTAAVIAGLDLVIAVDTAVVHLAGAMGKPVWMLTSTKCDWRWGLGGETSPWYPTLRLFRQTVLDDWSGPMTAAAAALTSFRPGDGGSSMAPCSAG